MTKRFDDTILYNSCTFSWQRLQYKIECWNVDYSRFYLWKTFFFRWVKKWKRKSIEQKGIPILSRYNFTSLVHKFNFQTPPQSRINLMATLNLDHSRWKKWRWKTKQFNLISSLLKTAKLVHFTLIIETINLLRIALLFEYS